MLSVGTHQATVIKSQLSCSDKGTEWIEVLLETEDGDQVVGRLFWTEKTQDRTRRALALMGWGGAFNPDESLKGPFKRVQIGIKEEVDQRGGTRLVVDWIAEPPPIGLSEKHKMPSNMARTFAGQLSRAMKASTTKPMREPGDDGDDLQF